MNVGRIDGATFTGGGREGGGGIVGGNAIRIVCDGLPDGGVCGGNPTILVAAFACVCMRRWGGAVAAEVKRIDCLRLCHTIKHATTMRLHRSHCVL